MGDILTGAILYVLLKTIGIPEEYQAEMNRKKEICHKCPLKVGNFCSKKYAQRVDVYGKAIGSKGIVVPKKIAIATNGLFHLLGKYYKRGCGCFLPFKQLSDSNCPLKKW